MGRRCNLLCVQLKLPEFLNIAAKFQVRRDLCLYLVSQALVSVMYERPEASHLASYMAVVACFAFFGLLQRWLYTGQL